MKTIKSIRLSSFQLLILKIDAMIHIQRYIESICSYVSIWLCEYVNRERNSVVAGGGKYSFSKLASSEIFNRGV